MGDDRKDMIGDYELINLIGDGAQGRVYQARCTSDSLPYVKLGEEVALKVVRVTGDDDSQRIKFQEQAAILKRLSHSSIVSYRDCFTWHAGEWDEAQCLVMELLVGEPLNERLKKSASGLPWPLVETIFEQCLSGLIHARECGITHRDIKPSNIFLTNSGEAKLIDFDIARRDDSAQMSTAGWKGTFDYMAPDFITVENFRGDEISDIFSLGVCFYQALTGTLPFEPLGETAHIGYLNRWRGALEPTPSFRPGVFRVLTHARNVIIKALTMKREVRYASFAAMLEDFRKIRYRRIRHKNKDEYELLAVLGRGGFGEVFKARRASDGLLVAVKYLFSEKQSERFIKEAKILQQYSHPGLVKYVDFMVMEGAGGDRQFFLVMEFLEGMPGWTLRYRIKSEGALELQEVVTIFGCYLDALHFLHTNAKPIIHRDIKPGNLYAPLGQAERAKIFDLGVARDVTGTVTVGGVPGTLDYMAPEFALAGGDRGSAQSDLYALGLCLYEALTGKPVFGRLPSDLNSAWVAFQDRVRKPPEIAFDHLVFAQYPSLKRVVECALADKPEARYRSALAMREALEAALRPTLSAPEDDPFDVGEVTMATFNGLSPEPEAGVTLGTRPLEVAAEVAGHGLDEFVAAGKASVQRQKKRKFFIIAGTAAALLLILGGGIYTSVKIVKIVSSKLRDGGGETAVAVQQSDEVLKPEVVPTPEPPKPEVEPVKPAVAVAKPAVVEQPREEVPEAPVVTESAAAKEAAIVLRFTKELDELDQRLQRDKLAACLDGVTQLTAILAEMPINVALQERYSATRIAYLKVLAESVVLKDPLAERTQRLATIGEIVKLPAAAVLFGTELAMLRRGYEQQSGVAILRLANRSDTPLKVAAKGLAGDIELAAGATHELVVPVAGATQELLLGVHGVGSSQVRSESVKLARASGVEHDLVAFAPVVEAPRIKVEPKTVPPEVAKVELDVAPKTEPIEVTKAKSTEVTKVEPKAVAAAAAIGGTAFEVLVSPKEATIMLNGEPIDAGRVEVEPNQNYQLLVSCKGYKSVQQYYKANLGQTRRIDILLEKEKKRSIFGF